MPKMIQLRHVPDSLHRRLKSRAAPEGMLLSEFLIREARKVAGRPTMDGIRNRLAGQTLTQPNTSATAVLREERDSR